MNCPSRESCLGILAHMSLNSGLDLEVLLPSRSAEECRQPSRGEIICILIGSCDLVVSRRSSSIFGLCHNHNGTALGLNRVGNHTARY